MTPHKTRLIFSYSSSLSFDDVDYAGIYMCVCEYIYIYIVLCNLTV